MACVPHTAGISHGVERPVTRGGGGGNSHINVTG